MSEPLHTSERQSVGELLSEVTRDLSTLLRQEVELAKAEARQSAKQASKAGALYAGAGVAGHLVLVFLSVALWWALGDALDNWAWSAVIVAVIWAIVAAVLAVRARAETRRVSGMPNTTDTVKKIPNALQGHEEKN